MRANRAAPVGQHFSVLHNCLSRHHRLFGAVLILWLISALPELCEWVCVIACVTFSTHACAERLCYQIAPSKHIESEQHIKAGGKLSKH